MTLDRPYEDLLSRVPRLDRDLADLRSTAMGRMVPRARLDVPVFMGTASTNQSLTSGTLTAINLNVEHLDTHGGHDNATNNSRWTCPAGWGGIYWITGRVLLNMTVTNQVVQCSIGLNGTNIGYSQSNTFGDNDFSSVAGPILLSMVPGDYVQVLGAQYSGVSRSTVGDKCALAVMFARRAA